MTGKHSVRKTGTVFVQHLAYSLANQGVELTLVNGIKGLSIRLRKTDEFDGSSANLSPREARELAAELLARADEIDTNAGEWR
jgi:hypothetical protein